MQLKITLLLLALVHFSFCLTAQKNFVDSAITRSKIDAEGHLINKTSDKVNAGIDNIFNGNLFKKKNKPVNQGTISSDKTSSSQAEKGNTQIIVTSTNYAYISNLSDALKSNQQVTNVERTFSNGTGTLKVAHNCTPDQLLDDLQKKAGDKFEVVEVSEGKITLKMK